MSKDDEIDLLRRELADLRERVARLEAAPKPAIVVNDHNLGLRYTSAPARPLGAPLGLPLPNALPPSYPAGPSYTAPAPMMIGCSCPSDHVCASVACPRRSSPAIFTAGG